MKKCFQQTLWMLTLLGIVSCSCAGAQPATLTPRFAARADAGERASLAALTGSLPASPQQANSEEARIATREKLRKLLDEFGPRINVAFKQSERQPFNLNPA